MGSMLRLRSPWARYGLALAATALASLLHFLAGQPVVDSDVSYFGFILAILAASAVGGLGPGLLATGLSAFASAYLFLAPVFSMRVASDEQLARLIVFAGEGILLSFVGDILRDARITDITTSWIMRYLPALLFVSTATGLKLIAFRDLERALPFTFFYAAIAASAWWGGFGPGLMATLVASLAARYFFLIPRYSLTVFSSINAARVSLFMLEGIFISGLTSMYPKTRRIASDAVERMLQFAYRLRRGVQDIRALRLTTSDVIWEWDPVSNRMIRGTTEMERPDTSAATMTLGSWLQQIHPDDRPAVAASLNSALREGREEWLCEYRRLRPDGASANISDRAYIIRDAAGNPVRLVGRSADVTEAKRAARIYGAERQYRAVFEQSPLAILLTDNALHVISANRAAADVLGYSSAQLLGMHVEKVVQEKSREAIMETLLGLTRASRPAITLEEECIRADGELFRAKINAAVIFNVEERSIGWVIMIEEIAG
jgi:PAS domain S-box-containing protein